jgi:hypothetical protein
MVSTMPSFFQPDPTMNFPSQHDDFFAQYYPTPYRSASAPQFSSVEAQSLPAPNMWNEDAFAQPNFYHQSPPLQTQTTLPVQATSFWSTSAPLADTDTTYLQTTPSFTFSPAQVSGEFVFGQPSNNTSTSRHSRGLSFASVDSYASTNAPSPDDASESNFSRSSSPGTADLTAYGYLNHQGTWSCAYPGCTSRAVFTRGCDLRKHHKRHTKSFFCRSPGCSQATGGGFSSKKDLARHEAKHNPGVVCEWHGCDRVFSRVDNMRDHVKRIHLKAARRSSDRASR